MQLFTDKEAALCELKAFYFRVFSEQNAGSFTIKINILSLILQISTMDLGVLFEEGKWCKIKRFEQEQDIRSSYMETKHHKKFQMLISLIKYNMIRFTSSNGLRPAFYILY